jgi:hypothetical protein
MIYERIQDTIIKHAFFSSYPNGHKILELKNNKQRDKLTKLIDISNQNINNEGKMEHRLIYRIYAFGRSSKIYPRLLFCCSKATLVVR